MSRVAGIIVNLVPYHHARWETFSQLPGTECHLVELTDRDTFRVLEFSATASYQRHTLFPHGGRESISASGLCEAMRAKLGAIRPKVVCVSGWALRVSLAALTWATENRIPVVMLSESNEFDETRSACRETVKRQVVGLGAAGLAGGKPQAAYLVKLGMQPESVFVGYDVVDNRYFADKAAEIGNRKSEIGNQYGLPEKYFLASARFGEKKNLPRLIEAYAKYRQLAAAKAGIWELVIAGDGEKRPDIEAAIRRLGVSGSVHLLGAKSYTEMPALYGLAAAFVHASTTEQWGLVVNEAMASGLPVLVSNRCGCAADLVQEGVNGFTFDPLNTEQLANLMLKISAFQDVSLSAFGSESQRIISEWGPERFRSGLEAAVNKALEVGPVRPSLLQRVVLKALLLR